MMALEHLYRADLTSRQVFMTAGIWRTLLAGFVSIAFSGPALGQQVDSVSPEPECAACSLRFTQVAKLGGDTEAAGLISERSVVVRDSKGRLYVAPTYVEGVINQYSARGAPTRHFGRSGEGPAENRNIVELAMGPGDSLYVFDHGNARFSVWTPGGEFARVGQVPGYPYEAYVLPDGRIVLQAWIRTPREAGLPIHLLDPSGRIIRSFGNETGAFRYNDPLARFRALAVTDDQFVWSGRYNRYELDRWSLEGELQTRLVREVEWFPPRDGVAPPPQPTLRGLAYDEAGLLWVLINVPDPHWTGDLEPNAQPSIERDHRMFDTMIEVIDTETGRLLLSHRHPLAIFRFVAPGLLPVSQEREDGALFIEIWRVEVEGLDREGRQ